MFDQSNSKQWFINSLNSKQFLEALDLVEVEEYELQNLINEHGTK